MGSGEGLLSRGDLRKSRKDKAAGYGGEREEVVQVGRYPCGMCRRGVGVNSILCISCNKWCHKRCSGLGRLGPAVNFRSPMCVRGVVVRGRCSRGWCRWSGDPVLLLVFCVGE